jgi:hypothetical protein
MRFLKILSLLVVYVMAIATVTYGRSMDVGPSPPQIKKESVIKFNDNVVPAIGIFQAYGYVAEPVYTQVIYTHPDKNSIGVSVYLPDGEHNVFLPPDKRVVGNAKLILKSTKRFNAVVRWRDIHRRSC